MRRGDILRAGAIFCVALALRLAYLGSKPFWADEFWAIALTDDTLSALWDFITRTEINPPLFYALVKWWAGSAGLDEFRLRLLPAVLGACHPVLLFVFLRRFLPQRHALAASLLLAVAPMHLTFSQLLKTYTLFGCLTLLSLILLDVAIRRPGRLLPWLILGIVNAATAYCHNFAWLLFLVEAVFFVAFVRTCWAGAFLSALTTGIIFLPWLPSFLIQASRAAGLNKGELSSQTLRVGYTLFTFVCGESINPLMLWLVVPAGCATLVLCLLAVRPWIALPAREKWLLLLFLCLPLGVNATTRFSWPQNFIPFLPGFLFLVTLGGCDGRPRRLAVACMGIFLAAQSLADISWYRGDTTNLHDVSKNLPYRRIAGVIESGEQEGDVVVTTENREFVLGKWTFSGFDWYYRGGLPVISLFEAPRGDALAALARLPAGTRRVWLLLNYNASYETNAFLKRWFDTHGRLLLAQQYVPNERLVRGRLLKTMPRYYHYYELYLYRLEER